MNTTNEKARALQVMQSSGLVLDGAHLSGLLGCGLSLAGRLGQFGPDGLPVVGAKIAAGDGPTSRQFDCHAMNRVKGRATGAPVAYYWLGNADGCGQLADAVELFNCGVECIHAPIITTVIEQVNTKVIHNGDEISRMETTGQRLKRLRESKGLSQGALATQAGLKSQGTIGNIERETRGYGESVVDIARVLGVTPDYLRGDAVGNVLPGPDMRGRIPLISWVAAGAWLSAADPHLPGEAERWLECPVSHSSGTFALRVRGDSMTAPHGNSRTYPEGSIIFVDPERRSPSNGDRVIACLEGSDEVTFKIYKNEDGRQWLQPLNPSHEPIREVFKVLGTVLGKWEDG